MRDYFAKALHSLFARPDSSRFAVVDGCRAIAILWVICFHTLWMFGFHRPADEFLAMSERPVESIILHGHYGVDLFFVISGFLIGRLLLLEFGKTQTIQVRRFYWRRFLRLMPAYLVAMALVGILLPENLSAIWANLLYVNNFIPYEGSFMPWTWSLAIEEQFYLCCPLLILLGMRWKKLGWILTIGIGISIPIRYWASLRAGITLPVPIHSVVDSEGFYQFFDAVYAKTHTRYGGLLIGVALAFVQFHFPGPISKKIAQPLIIAALGIIVLILASPGSSPASADVHTTAIWIALIKNIFAFAVAILFFACLRSPPQMWLNRFLSHRLWYPIAQLSYSAYLLHLLVIGGLAHFFYETAPTQIPWLLLYCLIAILGTLTLAFPLYAFVEKPIMKRRGN